MISAKNAIRYGTFGVLALLLAALASLSSGNFVMAAVDPPAVDLTLDPGDSVDIKKIVGTPAIPPVLDFCLDVDNSGSYGDDIANIKSVDDGLFDAIRADVADSKF